MSEVYAITNLEGYVTQMREVAAKSLAENNQENLDQYITVNQMMNLVKSGCVGFDDQDRPLLDEDTNEKIFNDTTVWLHNAGLAKLAAQDLIECAWDSELNEMVFWAKSKTQESKNERTKKSRRKNKKTEG
jgi:hypothetical protein